MMFSLVPIADYFYGRKSNKITYIFAIFSALFCVFQEQCVCIILAIAAILFLYQVKNKSVRWYVIVVLCIAIAGLIFTLTCPGNKIRTSQEIDTYMPYFNLFSPIGKLTIGIVTGFSYLLKY